MSCIACGSPRPEVCALLGHIYGPQGAMYAAYPNEERGGDRAEIATLIDRPEQIGMEFDSGLQKVDRAPVVSSTTEGARRTCSATSTRLESSAHVCGGDE